LPSDSAPHALAHTPTHARARLHAHRAVPGWHAPSIIGMRDLQAAAARICVCKGGRGDCRQILPRTHSHTHPHTRAHACMPTALCRDGTRRVSSACAICKLLLREYAFARGGGVIAVRFCPARTRTHTHTRARARLHAHRAVPGWHAPSIIGMRDLQAAAARICVCDGGRGDCRQNLPRTHSHTHARARLHAHRAVPGRHARSIIGMRDLQAAAARICVCEGGGGGDCRQILPRAHSHTHARLHANRRAPWRISG
jgi:hypothetical protein